MKMKELLTIITGMYKKVLKLSRNIWKLSTHRHVIGLNVMKKKKKKIL